jgi:hypothetical protein
MTRCRTRALREKSIAPRNDKKRTAVSDPYAKIIAQAYEQDEKKELKKELKIWKKTLSKEASDANVVWPKLKPD